MTFIERLASLIESAGLRIRVDTGPKPGFTISLGGPKLPPKPAKPVKVIYEAKDDPPGFDNT